MATLQIIGTSIVIIISTCIYSIILFRYGAKEGYKKAQREISEHADVAVRKTFTHVEEDRLKLRKNQYCNDIYMVDKQVMTMLPRWTLHLLGTEYVLRCPLRRQWNTMWLMTKENSRHLDMKINDMFEDTKYEIKVEDKEIAMKVIIDKLYSSLSTFCIESIDAKL